MKNESLHITDKEFGEVEVVYSQRATRIRISIRHNHLRLSLPPHASVKEGLDFLESVRLQIRAKQSKLQTKKPSAFINEDNPLRTLSFTTEVRATAREKVFFRLKDRILRIEYPEGIDVNSEQTQKAFKNGIDFFLRKEAKRLLPPRVTQLAEKHHFSVKEIKIQSSKTRWGSCSSKRSINLSYFLLTLPAHLIDYVILHELCHTVEMNHGERFWQLMDRVTEHKTKILRKELKGFSTHL